jgi:hypothetical protein
MKIIIEYKGEMHLSDDDKRDLDIAFANALDCLVERRVKCGVGVAPRFDWDLIDIKYEEERKDIVKHNRQCYQCGAEILVDEPKENQAYICMDCA